MYLGIDPSLTATGLAALGEDGGITLETVSSSPGLSEPRLLSIKKRITDFVDRHRPHIVVIEALAFSRNDPSAQERAALHYMLRCYLYRTNQRFVCVAPSALKKFVTGKGNSEKSMMLREVFRRWKVVAADDNQADAAALAYIGAVLAGGREAETTAQREVIAKLLAGPVKKKKKGVA